MAQPNAYEQLTLEYINLARTDPRGEFARLISDAGTRTAVASNITNAIRFFSVDMTILKTQFDALTPAAPLAWSDQLNQSAATHNQLMINFDTQSHDLPGEPSLLNRVQATGYNLRSVGENVFLNGQDPLYTHAAFFIDWGGGPTGIQTPPGHRDSIMNPAFTEIGVSAIAENNPATKAGPFVVTHHIAQPATPAQRLLGVVINDADRDNFYDMGEGLAGVSVSATGTSGTFTTTSRDAGGYQLDLPNGTYTVTYSGGGLASNVTRSVTMAGANVKVDVVAPTGPLPTVAVMVNGVTTNVTVTPYSGPANGILWQHLGTGVAREQITGTTQADFINGLAGDDVIFGQGGNDILDGGIASNFLTGGPGTDTFFTDARNGQVGWSTIVDFVPGSEQVTIWGFRPGVTRVFWENNYGAPGFEGATAFFDMDGSSQTDRSGVDFAVTFTGHSVGNLGPSYELDGLMWFRPLVA